MLYLGNQECINYINLVHINSDNNDDNNNENQPTPDDSIIGAEDDDLISNQPK